MRGGDFPEVTQRGGTRTGSQATGVLVQCSPHGPMPASRLLLGMLPLATLRGLSRLPLHTSVGLQD